MENFEGERSGSDWEAFMEYAKRFWFSNGIHHHYSYNKFEPGFSPEYLKGLLEAVGHELSEDVMRTMFDPSVDGQESEQSRECGSH